MKRYLALAALILIFAFTAAFPAALQIDMLLSQVRTNAGGSLAGGHVHFYSAGGSTNKTVWTDYAKTTPAANPYTLDSNGTALLYGDGLYRIVIHTSAGTTAFDRDNIRYEDIAGAVTRITSLTGDGSGNISGFDNLSLTGNITGDNTGNISGFTIDNSLVNIDNSYRLSAPYVDVRTYIPSALHAGIAAGTDNTDLWTYIEAATSYANNNGIGEVRFPDGTYKHSLALTGRNNVSLIGYGPKVSILNYTGSTGNGIELDNNAGRINLVGIKLYSSNSSSGTAINDNNISDNNAVREFNMENYEVEGFKNGIHLSLSINAKIGVGRWIGQGKTVSGGKGIHLGSSPDASNYASITEKAYISGYETGYYGDRDHAGLMLNPIIESCAYPVKSSGTLTLVSPYFEGNTSTNPLITSEASALPASIIGRIVVINPFVYESNYIWDISSRVSGENIFILHPGNIVSRAGAGDSSLHLSSYSTNAGHVPWLRMSKSHDNNYASTPTIDTEYLGRISASGITSDNISIISSDILFRQIGTSGDNNIKSDIALRVGTDNADISDTLVVRAPADGEVGFLVQRNNGGALTLQRVTVGIDNSAGAGYRVLRVPN